MSTLDSKHGKKPYHHGHLDDALVELALEVVLRDGPDAVSMRELAKQVGVSPAAPYRHFPDKSALLAAVAERGFEELEGRFEQVSRGGGQEIEDLGQAYIRFAQDRPALFRLMFGRRQFEWTGKERVPADRTFDRLMGAVRARLGADSTEPAVREGAYAAWCLIHGAAMLTIDGICPENGQALNPSRLLVGLVALSRG